MLTSNRLRAVAWRLLFQLVTLTIILHTNPAAILAQVSFTRITGDPVTSDGGLSRGIVFVDYDNDKYPDVYVTNSSGGAEENKLYRNNGNGTFTRVEGSPLVTFAQNSDCSTWGDYDNDGDPDVFVATWSNQFNRLYRNEAGSTFTQILAIDPVASVTYSDYANWVDYDRDGWLDLFVGYGFNVLQNKLYHNNGDGTFSITTSGAIITDAFRTHGCAWGDYDNDGEIDLFVANSSAQNNNLYRNLGDGTFEKIIVGDIVNDGGQSLKSNWGDIDNDLDIDLYVSNGLNEANFLYRNNGDGTFTRILTGDAVTEALPSQAVAFADFDNDGDNDLFVSNGFGPSTLTNSLFWNDGTGAFTKDTLDIVATETGSGLGASVADCDRDGDLDIVLGKGLGDVENNALFLNNGNSNHWLSVTCIGVVSNRSGIGTRLRAWATIGGQPVAQLRDISAPTSFGNTGLTAWFGLGDATQLDSLIIDWPSGIADTIYSTPSNDYYMAVEGLGSLCSGVDSDNDGYPDVAGVCVADNCADAYNPDQVDGDNDGLGDACDACPADPDNDVDGDLVCAPADNCPIVANGGQEDTDSDGIGDACCCSGMRGNINADPGDAIDISDLTYLTSFMFKGGTVPPCPNEADVNGDTSTDIADLTSLVAFMFKSGSNPAICP